MDPRTLSEEQWVARCLEDRRRVDRWPRKRLNVKKKNKANLLIRFFHSSFELLCSIIPGLEYVTLSYIFPFYAYYLVV